MATLKIEYRKPKWMPLLPHKLIINGQLLGIMQQPQVNVELPAATYRVRVESMIRFFSSERYVSVADSVENRLEFSDKEGLWDWVFWVALVAEVVHCFITLEPKWNILYHVVDDGLFAAWLIYEWCIRKRYFKMEFWQSPIATSSDQ